MLRKLSFIILFTVNSVFSAVYALPATSALFLVAIPNLKPGFAFDFTALALKPGASNLNYVIFNKELPAQSPTWNEKEINPSYNFGFELSGSYIFPCSGEAISLDWTHLNTSNSTSIVAPSDSYFLGPDYEIGPDAIPIRDAYGKAQFKYDVINLNASQYVDFGSHVQMQFFGGLSTAFLREQVTSIYSGHNSAPIYLSRTSAPVGSFSTMQEVTANFTGIGPRIGMEANYNFESGFGLLGEAAVSALFGSTYSKTSYTSSGHLVQEIFGQNINNQYIKDQNVTQVIPGLDAKLGVMYKHAFNTVSSVTVKAGYQGAVYINAISQYLPGTLVVPLDTGGIFVATMDHKLSNYSVQGPFLEAMVQF